VVNATTRQLYPGERDAVLIVRNLCGTLGLSGRVHGNFPPPGFDPGTVQPVASRNNNYAIYFTKEFFDQGYSRRDCLLGCDVVQSDVCRTFLIKLLPLLSRYAGLLL
jgi:hypothetical protein